MSPLLGFTKDKILKIVFLTFMKVVIELNNMEKYIR